MRRTISAVITTHRRPQLLLRALRSIAAEEHAPDEILIVEDGEDPGLPGLLAETGIPHRLVQGRCGGAAAARNRALHEATGDYVIFLDDDDVAYPIRIRELAKAVSAGGRSLEAGGLSPEAGGRNADAAASAGGRSPDAAAAAGGRSPDAAAAAGGRSPDAAAAAHGHDADLVFGATLKRSDSGHWPVPTHYPPEPSHVDFRHVLSCMPHINAVLVRRERLIEAGGFQSRSTYFDDWCAWLTLLDRGARAHYTPALVAEFSDTPQGLTRTVMETGSLSHKIREALTCVAWSNPAHESLVARVIDALPSVSASLRSYDDYANLRFVHPSRDDPPEGDS